MVLSSLLLQALHCAVSGCVSNLTTMFSCVGPSVFAKYMYLEQYDRLLLCNPIFDSNAYFSSDLKSPNYRSYFPHACGSRPLVLRVFTDMHFHLVHPSTTTSSTLSIVLIPWTLIARALAPCTQSAFHGTSRRISHYPCLDGSKIRFVGSQT